jgi:hypothetical protein
LGGLALAGFYLALLFISPSAMGLGDVKLAAAGFLPGGLVGIALLVSGRATKKQHIPFRPAPRRASTAPIEPMISLTVSADGPRNLNAQSSAPSGSAMNPSNDIVA